MNRNRKSVLVLLLSVFLIGCAASRPAGSGSTWITFPEGAGDEGATIESWVKTHPLKPGEEVALHEISRGETSSSHLVIIRKEEKLHTHNKHELVAILLKGQGVFTLGRRQIHLKPGAILSIPRGVPHGFQNQSAEPAVAYAVFVPAFDGKDTVPVESSDH